MAAGIQQPMAARAARNSRALVIGARNSSSGMFNVVSVETEFRRFVVAPGTSAREIIAIKDQAQVIHFQDGKDTDPLCGLVQETSRFSEQRSVLRPGDGSVTRFAARGCRFRLAFVPAQLVEPPPLPVCAVGTAHGSGADPMPDIPASWHPRRDIASHRRVNE